MGKPPAQFKGYSEKYFARPYHSRFTRCLKALIRVHPIVFIDIFSE